MEIQLIHMVRKVKSMKNKTALIIRYGAYGDMVMITPVIKRLKELGYKVILNTSKRGMEILQHDTNIDKMIPYNDESVPIDKLNEHWKKVKEKIKPDWFCNFTESIECNVALHPIQPMYIYPKEERYERCNRNYYDVTEEWAGLEGCDKIPSLYFTKTEKEDAKYILKDGKINILWAMSGSGRQKVYPWVDYVMGELFLKYKEKIHIITIGDEKCQLLESLIDRNITNLSGKITMRMSMCLTGLVDLVISPDTGVLHASGCYETPKIALLGHTTGENITKYFKNAYPIEANCACAPCFRLIYDHGIQCPVEPVTKAAWCMAEGISPEIVFNKIDEVIQMRCLDGKSSNIPKEMSSV